MFSLGTRVSSLGRDSTVCLYFFSPRTDYKLSWLLMDVRDQTLAFMLL